MFLLFDKGDFLMKNLKEYDKHDDIEYYCDPAKINDSLEEKEREKILLDDNYKQLPKEDINDPKFRDSRIGFINNFYNFRKRLSYIKNVNKSMINKHRLSLNISSDITLSDLLYSSIEYFNNNMKSNKIILDPQLLIDAIEQYNACDFVYNIDNKKCAFDMYFIQNHNTTKFFTMIMLYYLYNKHFAQKIKDYKKDHKDVTDVIMLAIIYKKLIEFSPSFDNYNNLK